MTPASKHMHALAFGTARSALKRAGSKVRRKAVSAVSSALGGKKRRRRSSSKAHLVKGSPAAKAHMAKLRKMVGKRKA